MSENMISKIKIGNIEYELETTIDNVNGLQNVLDEKATENFVLNKIAEARLDGSDIDLSGYATKDEVPTKTSDLVNDSGYLTAATETDPTVPSWAKASTKPKYTKSEVGLGNVDNVKQYSDSNPPPYPVTSVNGKTGTVSLNASDVGALPNTTVIPTVPTNVSAFTNDAGYLTEHQSLNGYATENYVNTQIAAIPTPDVSGQISSHNTATGAHNDIRLLISGLTTRLNTLANSDDTTLDQMSEVVAYIKNNKSLIDGITTSKVNVSDIINNLTTNVSNKPLSAAQGVAIKSLIDTLQEELDSHTHSISEVSGLQTALDGKAASSHGTHVSYSTTAPVMDGTASVGSASTVARSDHKHPTDTSRASKTEFDTHVSDTTKHITSTERTNWNAAKTHADSAHAPSNAEKNQNAFSNIVVSGTTIAADTVTDTLTLAGSNVTITPDATNDKVTIGITNDNVVNALGYTPSNIESVNALSLEKADIIQSVSGEVISVNNSAHTPLKGLKVFGKTEQNGTPTPDAPIPLESVGDVTVTVAGKNLLPAGVAGEYTVNGVTFTSYGDGHYHMKGTATANAGYNFALEKAVTLPDNTPLSISLHNNVAHINQATVAFLYRGNQIDYMALNAVDRTLSYESGNGYEGKTIDAIRLYVVSGATVDVDLSPTFQIAPGGAFESHSATTVTVSTPNGLPGIPVTSGGNYTDSTGQQWICDEVDFEKGVYVQRVVDIEANGADGHSYQALNGYFRIAYTGLIDRGAGLCNIGKVYTSFSAEGIYYNADFVYFRFDSLGVNSTQMTVADMKVWLSEHPIKLKAILATEKTYELSVDQLAAFAALHSNYPNTTVFNDRDAGMEVKYYTPTTAVPMVHSPSDEGKILTIDEHGCVTLKEETSGIPTCTTSNNGQFLRVVSGVPAWSTISSAEGASF